MVGAEQFGSGLVFDVPVADPEIQRAMLRRCTGRRRGLRQGGEQDQGSKGYGLDLIRAPIEAKRVLPPPWIGS